ncbi:hypothetical protein [Halomarina oriensis]|uniref:Uncharacterized protein n=1 Tax=Halomarina oriensis TaxID=671145 RepID=A0A6B0GNM1_9EURY|nr:hypothetical protein [Halomarina oriensis]MWG36526.1 hypothetical protein [Halomarina oriensis]
MNVPNRRDWSFRRVCQHGHRGCFITDAEGWVCPVPECTPYRIVDCIDCALVWEGERPSGVVA